MSVQPVDVSVIIPVFNKSGLTRVCLSALERTLPKSATWEVIVIDNNSSDDTQTVLAGFPWIHVVSNDENLGFAGGNNQGARLARGRFLMLLNNDTEPQAGWLDAMLRAGQDPQVGIVGARLLFPNRTIQHAGVVIQSERFGPYGITPYHYLWSAGATDKAVMARKDFQAVTAACLLTPRELYLELGGLDEVYWNGYEDVDYCFKVLRAGKRIVYEPQSAVIHFESQSGPLRFSRVAYNSSILAERWTDFPRIDHNHHYLDAGNIRRWVRFPDKLSCVSFRTPQTTLFVHGSAEPDPENWKKTLFSSKAPIEKVVWCAQTPAPDWIKVPVVRGDGGNPTAMLRSEMQFRGDRYVAVLDTATGLEPEWLDELIENLEWGPEIAASTTAPALPVRRDIAPLTADARCTLLSLRQFPLHEELADFDTLHGSLADFLLRFLRYEFATRAVAIPVARTGALPPDASFERAYGAPLESFLRDDAEFVEVVMRRRLAEPRGGKKASIVMLSWNAPAFTKIALESIRQHTKMDYEVIIVDNGSEAETTDWLKTLTGVTVIYNPSNRGFARGNNQGIAAATGDYIVVLNNDVVVTDGWLENLVDALERDPATGVSAPRSNQIAGDQMLLDAAYGSMEEMHALAARRAKTYRKQGYFTNRAIGFCLCIDRRVIEQIGGIDEGYGTGNFEDDDFCMRVRGAGYRIYVCDDVFIHHFGSVSFQTNKVDYAASMHRNWSRFSATWGYGPTLPQNGYDPTPAIRRGFDRAKHFQPLPEVQAAAETSDGQTGTHRLLLCAAVADERDWGEIGAVVRRFVAAFTSNDSVALAIACSAALDAETVGARIENMLQKQSMDPAHAPDIFVSDEADAGLWFSSFEAQQRYEIAAGGAQKFEGMEVLRSRSRNDLEKLYAALAGAAQ